MFQPEAHSLYKVKCNFISFLCFHLVVIALVTIFSCFVLFFKYIRYSIPLVDVFCTLKVDILKVALVRWMKLYSCKNRYDQEVQNV